MRFIVSITVLMCGGESVAQPAYEVGMGSASIEPDVSIFSLALAGYGLPREGRFSMSWSYVDDPREVRVVGDALQAVTVGREARKFLAQAKRLISADSEVGSIVSLTADDNTLYALNSGDSIFSGTIEDDAIRWTMIGRRNGVTFDVDMKSIAVASGRLYGLGVDGRIYVNRHRSDGKLGVQAMAVQRDGSTVVIAAADVCGFEYAFIQSVKKEIARRHGLSPSAVLINATHTHFAPITQDFGPMGPFYEKPNDAYMQIVYNGIVEAVDVAMANLSPADIYFGRGTTAIGKNRRLSANPAAPYDNTLDVLAVRDAENEITGVLFTTACHPVFRNAGAESFTISANYPGVARSSIQATARTENVIFLQGCGGDINPASPDHRKTGVDLAQDVVRVMDDQLHRVSGDLSWSLDTIRVDVPMWHRSEIEAFRNESLEHRGDLEAERNIRWADKMLAHLSRDERPDALDVYVQIVDIGDWRLVGLSREAVNEYATGIRALWPDKKVTVAGYCNDVSSYLPNDWHIQAGIYEGKGSFFWYGVQGPFPEGTYDRVIDAVRSMRK